MKHELLTLLLRDRNIGSCIFNGQTGSRLVPFKKQHLTNRINNAIPNDSRLDWIINGQIDPHKNVAREQRKGTIYPY